MKKSKSLYHGHRFPAEVISCAVRWYFRFQLSLRAIRREQPPTNARTRASHARLSRPETHTEISLVLRADQATLRAQAASAARFTLSQTAHGAIRCLARTHRSHPKSVLRVLRDAFSCRLSASVSTS